MPTLMVLKCAIWLSAAGIPATPHHCIHLVLVQPPGVKVGWSGHAALQHHILSSLTQPYVGYTVMLQLSPAHCFIPDPSICQSPSLRLPPTPSAYTSRCLRMAFGSGSQLDRRQFLFICVILPKPGLFLALPNISIIMSVSALHVHLLWPPVHLFSDFHCCALFFFCS